MRSNFCATLFAIHLRLLDRIYPRFFKTSLSVVEIVSLGCAGNEMLSLSLGPALIFTILSKLRCGCDCLDKIVQREILDSSFSERGRDWERELLFSSNSHQIVPLKTVAAFFNLAHPDSSHDFPPRHGCVRSRTENDKNHLWRQKEIKMALLSMLLIIINTRFLFIEF